jgi:NAD(P)-dependent dehydrogenase (short-subunit alcohol dehydrogenase family)
MSGQLHGKTALVTGAAHGIGKATATLLAQHGARVLVTDINERLGETLAASLPGAKFMRVDVADERDVSNAVDHAVKEFGQLDIMINNAGLVGVVGSISRIDAKEWDSTMRVLLDGVFFGLKHASRVMMPRRSGRILVTSSSAGVVSGVGAHCYTAAKHGVIGLVKSVAAELASFGICVNSVAPSVTVTQMAIDGLGSVEAATKLSADVSPMARAIMPEDVANIFLFLSGDQSRNITGQTLVIDGGWMALGTGIGTYTYK